MNYLKNLSEASVLTDELASNSNDGNEYDTGNLSGAKKHFSKIGIGIFAIYGVCFVVQVILMCLANIFWQQGLEHPWGIWLLTFAPLYLIAVPIGLLLLRKVPAKPIEKHHLKPSRYIVMAIICLFMMCAGNILGLIVTKLLQLLFGVSVANPILGYAMDNTLLPKILFMVILAPVFEEYVFRKQLIDRMHMYGQKIAVVTSALMFGLFHGNLPQFFYAFTLGLGLGYIYLKTGKLRYSIGVHMLINFNGSIIAPIFSEKLTAVGAVKNLETPWLIYWLVFIGIIITGLILLCINKSKISFESSQMELPKKNRFKTVYMNVGMILFIVFCMLLIIVNTMSLS